jgi:hypothetical protein
MKYRLTVEKTKDEVNWTFGFPVPRSELARTFGVALPITTSSSFGGSPYASSYDRSSSSGSPEQLPPWATALIIVVFIFLMIATECSGSGGGGGHGSYGGGGGISFGK